MSLSIRSEISYLTTAQELNRRLASAAQRGNVDLYMALWGQLERLSELGRAADGE